VLPVVGVEGRLFGQDRQAVDRDAGGDSFVPGDRRRPALVVEPSPETSMILRRALWPFVRRSRAE
jgi:hypothetical protein